MERVEKEKFMTNKFEEILSIVETEEDLLETLFVMSSTVGSLVNLTARGIRDDLFVSLVEAMTAGYTASAERMGEPSNMQVTKGEVHENTH